MNLNFIVTAISVVVCIFIIIDILYYFKSSSKVNKYFKEMLDDFYENKDNGEFKNDSLNKIKSEFISSLYGVVNVNTQVIIEKNLYPEDNKLVKRESKLDYLISLATTLGLLGTFIGLTCAIISMSISISSADVESFIQDLKPAMYSMGGAFTTSIFGLIASIIMNIFGTGYKITKQNLIDAIEDNLDNEEAKKKFSDSQAMIGKMDEMVRAINIMGANVKQSSEEINNLVKDIGVLNDEIKGFNSNIEKNSSNLIEATNNFEKVVDKFEKPLSEFRFSMDKFVTSYKGLDEKTEILSDVVDKSLSKSIDKLITFFDENTKQQMKFIEENNGVQKETIKSMNIVSDVINDNLTNLKDTYTELSHVITTMQEKVTDQQNNLNNVSNKLGNILDKLESEVSDLAGKVSSKTAKSIQEATDKSSEKMVKELQHVTDKLAEQLEEITKQFNKIQQEQQGENEATLKLMKETIQSIYTQVSELQKMNLVNA
ncbi:MAG: MotA/TolQ/ExbB proton channel family protein [Intestinibacter bartlettii]|uniref:MotA/TolQ/ExbB proton channel family protein n=1 Tax=Intestinibacter bartlettii TaxID=261299 RepID=UPI0026F1F149|nr:MotA/TolQ/ExbB proton channel family protein [Intestinibacter bartlettii]MDO5011385.1 MotA/TolQ/ExbB proton channel family protein [Intestinibacter bartlettii]